MLESIKKDGHSLVVNNECFEVRITPKIYDGGYTLTKTIKDQPLQIIEKREIRLPISETEIIKVAKKLLKQFYESVDPTHYNIQSI